MYKAIPYKLKKTTSNRKKYVANILLCQFSNWIKCFNRYYVYNLLYIIVTLCKNKKCTKFYFHILLSKKSCIQRTHPKVKWYIYILQNCKNFIHFKITIYHFQWNQFSTFCKFSLFLLFLYVCTIFFRLWFRTIFWWHLARGTCRFQWLGEMKL